jgi:rhodanese-related sulfurtransferase
LIRPLARQDLQTLLAAGTMTLIEALPVLHYDSGHLPGALNVPDRLTPDLAARLVPDTSRTVVTYRSGPACTRSKTAATAFTRLGYTDVRVYPGGKLDRTGAGLPLDTAHATAPGQ